MTLEAAVADEGRQRTLVEQRGLPVGERLGPQKHDIAQRRRNDHVTDPQRREHRFRKRPDVDDTVVTVETE